jgi:RHS repeat-associated protein
MKYEYALKDHLGNTRLMFSDKDNNGVISQHLNQELSEVSQENHYYAFGMAMEGNWMNTPSVLDNKYMYNGKELNSDFGLEWMDYGARMYDAAVGRWWVVDPMAESAAEWTPYRYGFDNPVRFIDPDGMYEGVSGNQQKGNIDYGMGFAIIYGGESGKNQKDEGKSAKSVSIPNKNQRPVILKMINDRASGQFDVDKNGRLYLVNKNKKDPKDDIDHSDYYRDRLVEAINGDKSITIIIRQKVKVTVKDDGTFLTEKSTKDEDDIDSNHGGGATWVGFGNNQLVVISGNSNYDPNVLGTDGKTLSATSGDILLHELLAHAIPHTIGSDTGNGVSNENKARSQMKKRLRQADENHKE